MNSGKSTSRIESEKKIYNEGEGNYSRYRISGNILAIENMNTVTLYGQTFPTIKSAATQHGIERHAMSQLYKKYGENQELFEKELEKTKERKKNSPTRKASVPITLYGQTYPSIRSAAVYHGVSQYTMKRLAMKYGKNQKLLEKEVKNAKKKIGWSPITITLYDQTYPSIKSAAYDHDICKSVMNQLFKKYGKNQELFEKEVEEAKKRKTMSSVPVTLFGHTYNSKSLAAKTLGIHKPSFYGKFMAASNPERLLLFYFYMRIQRVPINKFDSQLTEIYSYTDERGIDYFSYAGNKMSSTEILEKWLTDKREWSIKLFTFANVEYPTKTAFLNQYNLQLEKFNKIKKSYPCEVECMEHIKINQIENLLIYMGLALSLSNQGKPCYAFKSIITGENHYIIFDKSKIENYDNLSRNRQKELRYSETTATHKIMSQSQILELWEKYRKEHVNVQTSNQEAKASVSTENTR